MTNTHESRRCWSCGVDQHPKRPSRAHFASEPEWLVASLTWLDFTFPQRQQHRDRVQEWERLREETELEAIAARVRDLLSIDEWTDEQQDEADRLAAEYMERRAAARAQRSTTKESTTRS